MTSASRSGAVHVRVAPGSGALLRRATALLFIDGGTDSRAATMVDAFLASDESAIVEAVTDAVTSASFDVAPFALIAWNSQVHIVVFGPLDVRTDHASLPMLSGAGSTTWVERRVRPGDETVVVEAGASVDPATDLELGRVAAGGFAATFRTLADASSTTVSSIAPGSDPRPVAAPAPVASAEPPAPAPATIEPVADPTGPVSGDRLAALRAAMRVHDAATGSPDVTDPTAADAPPGLEPVDDEVTLAPHDPTPDQTSGPPTEPTAGHANHPDGPDELDDTPFVLAVRCPRGHVNPIHVSVCQSCGDLMDVGAPTETIRQPPLAMLELPTAEAIAVDRAIVIGRRPDHEAAQADPRAQLVVVSDDPSVSRTHVRIDVEDWSLTVTDCGSRSGTAIVVRPGEEPRILEPWVTHELPVGARLFLGGPTSVVIRAIPTRRGGRG